MARTRIPFLGLVVAGLIVSSNGARADDHADVDRLVADGQWTAAVQKADQFLASNPRDARMRFLKGLALSEQGKSSEAIAVFVKLTEDFPELPEPHNNLAVLYSKQGQYDQARRSLEAAIRTNPSYATAYENLGDVYAKLASQAYSKALQADASNNAKVGPKLAMIRDLFSPKAIASARTNAKPATVAAPTPPAPVVVAAAPKAPAATAPVAPTPPSASAPTRVLAAPAPAPAPPKPAPAAKASAPAPTAPTAPAASAAPAHAAPAPSPATDPASASTAAAAEAAATAWASAWSRKDVNAYFAAYVPDYGAGKPRKAWEEERRARIVGKRSISVVLTDFHTRVQGDRAVVQFRQNYSADALKVSSRKTLEMVQVSGRWLIQKESTGS